MKKENKQATKVSRKIWTSVLLAVLGIVLIVWPAASVSWWMRPIPSPGLKLPC